MSEMELKTKLLTELSDELEAKQLAELKFLVSDVVPKTELSQIDNGLALFDKLEKTVHTGLALLENLFQTIGREDLVKKMADTYKDDPKWRTDQPSDEHPTPYRTLLYDLGKEMTEDDMEIVKFMFKEDLGDSILECPFKLFEALEDHGKIGPPSNLSKLEEGMKMAGRDDLVTRIKEFSSKSDEAAGLARRRKDTPWVSKSPFAAQNQPQVVEEEEEEEETAAPLNSDASKGERDATNHKRRLSTIPEVGPKRVAFPVNTETVEEETSKQGETTENKQKGVEGSSSSDNTTSKDIPMTAPVKKKSSRFCVLL
ncbi:caspase-8-like [Branchiostoma lanceolatum]|uniref:caspase-8-like n=1 Tax=Branchiostoma lanceolatum TaxID=7740 RepID=UPI0034527C1B